MGINFLAALLKIDSPTFGALFTLFCPVTSCMLLYIKRKLNNQNCLVIQILTNQGARHCFEPKNTKRHMGESGIWDDSEATPFGVIRN